MLPLLAFVLFGLHVRKAAERIRAEDLRPRVLVRLKLAGSGMATRDEVRLRQSIEEAIEQREIGTVTDTGSGEGWATIEVTANHASDATNGIRSLLVERGLFDSARIEDPTAVPE